MSKSGFNFGGRNVGCISFGGKSVWHKTLSVSYYDILSSLISTEIVNFNSNALQLAGPELPKKKFLRWDKNLNNVVYDLSVYPIYVNQFDVTYKYQSDNSEITSQTYNEGETIVYPLLPKRDKYTVSCFIPDNFSISPCSADETVYAVDILNSVKYDCTNAYEYDGQYHDLQMINVHSFPTNLQLTTYYSEVSHQELTDYQDSDWSLSCPRKKYPGTYDIYIKFEGESIYTLLSTETLSIGEADIISVNFNFKTYDEKLSSACEKVFRGDDADVPDIPKTTLSTQFLRWNSESYKNVVPNKKYITAQLSDEITITLPDGTLSTYTSSYASVILSDILSDEIQISAIYAIKNFNVNYYGRLSNLVDTQLIEYGQRSSSPTADVEEPGYQHINWIDENGNDIDDELSFISSDISAYSYQKKICYVTVYNTYANQNKFLGSFKYLSGDIFQLSDFISENYSEVVAKRYPYFSYISTNASVLIGELSNYNNPLSLLFGSNFYDYDLFQPAYVLKYSNCKKANAKFVLNYNNDYVKVIDKEDDLYEKFYAQFILKYDNVSSAIAKFNKVDSADGHICVVEDDSSLTYYDSSKFKDRTAYILKYKNNQCKTNIKFVLNNNRVYTQAIEDYDVLYFNRIESPQHYFQITSNNKAKFEIKLGSEAIWKKYDFSRIKCSEEIDCIYVRALTLNDIEGCEIIVNGFDRNGSLAYLTSRYGERILPDSYYMEKFKNS